MTSMTVLFSALIQMTLITRLWILIGLDLKERYLRCGLFITLSSITIWVFIPSVSMTGYSTRYLVYIIILLIGKFTFKKPWKDILHDFFTIIIIVFCLQSFQLIFHKLMFQEYAGYQTQTNQKFFLIVANIVFLLFIFFSSFFEKMRMLLNAFKNSLRASPEIIMNFVLVIVLNGLVLDLYKEQVWNHIYFFFTATWLLYLYNFLGVKRIMELNEQKKAIEIYKQYYPIFSNIITDIRKKQHEFSNHLNTIYGLIHLGGMDWEQEMKQYIHSIKHNSIDTSQLILLENRVLAALIYSKLLETAPKDITFEYDLHTFKDYPVEDYELVEILCNLLNNAFDAVEQLVDRKRHVVLKMGSEEDIKYLEVRNNGIKFNLMEIENLFKEGYTTKGTGRGYGLFNAMTIIKRKKGKIEVFFEEEDTVFRVLFNDSVRN